jgi:hypothetical protein
MDLNLRADDIPALAAATAETTVSLDPVKGPERESTGRGLTG